MLTSRILKLCKLINELIFVEIAQKIGSFFYVVQ